MNEGRKPPATRRLELKDLKCWERREDLRYSEGRFGQWGRVLEVRRRSGLFSNDCIA